MRLNQWLVAAGVAPARRKADELISAGRVTVNRAVAELGYQVEETDSVRLDGRELEVIPEPGRLVAYYKPVGQICSHEQQGEAPTIFQSLPAEYQGWKVIGRLDKDSEGLVLLTNDGQLAQDLSHPSQNHRKLYRVWLDRKISTEDRQKLIAGVPLEEGLSKFLQLSGMSDGSLEFMLMTGWNRQIRRTVRALGYHVRQLKRLAIGPYELGNLESGQIQEMTVEA